MKVKMALERLLLGKLIALSWSFHEKDFGKGLCDERFYVSV